MTELRKWRESRSFRLSIFPVIFPCLYYLTHADLRYRHPIDPIVLLLTVDFHGGSGSLYWNEFSEDRLKACPTRLLVFDGV